MRVWGLVVCSILYSARAQAREGLVVVANVLDDGVAKSIVGAEFSNSPIRGPVIGSDGPCTLHTRDPIPGLAAGTITISGGHETITLAEPYEWGTHTGFDDDAPIAVVSTGSEDVPVFGGTVYAPRSLAGFVPPIAIERDGYALTWVPRSGQQMLIVIEAHDATKEIDIVCRVPDAGSFTIPASTFELLPAAFDHGRVTLSRMSEHVIVAGNALVTFDVMSSIRSAPVPITTAPRRAQSPERGMHHLALGIGTGGMSRVGATPPTNGLAVKVELGARLAAELDLVIDVEGADSDVGSDTSASLGVQWTPFAPHPRHQHYLVSPANVFDLAALYTTATLGTAHRMIEQNADWSPRASLAIGWLPLQHTDWKLGFEFREQLTHFDDRYQLGWQLAWVVKLE